jgi:putative SOS response-associated peptidase YedK
MCGRYVSTHSAEELREEFQVESNHASDLDPDYNVAPSKSVYAVLERPAKDDRPQQRQLRQLTWGLVPSWAKDPSIGNKLINVRLETVSEKPSFRRAFASRRTILPADGYYEWYQTQQKNAAGRPVKQPFFIHPKGPGSLAMAGIYEIWRDPGKSDHDPEQFRWTVTILTTSAEPALTKIHDRMPVLLAPDQYDAWLDPELKDPGAVLELLEHRMIDGVESHPVSAAVSNVRNNGSTLIDPIRLDLSRDHN